MMKKERIMQAIKDKEYSKRFTTSIRNCMFIHLGLTLVIDATLIFLGFDCSEINAVLVTMMPIYIALQGANYVKSGYENGKKITSTPSSSCCNQSENEDNG